MVEDDTLPDIPLSGYWMVVLADTDYSRGYAHVTTRPHVGSVFDTTTATPEIVASARTAALASVPAGETVVGLHLVVGPTDQLTENPPTT